MCDQAADDAKTFAMRVFAQAGVKDLKLVVEKTRDLSGQPQVSGTSQQVLGRFFLSLVDAQLQKISKACG